MTMRHTICILLLLLSLSLSAQRLRVTDEAGHPVAFVAVRDEGGRFPGFTDADGLLPSLDGFKTIELSHMGFCGQTVDVGSVGP